MLHDTILKHQTILDQLRSGLSILGFKKELEKAPAKFEHFFVHSSDEVSPAFVKSLPKPPVTHDAHVKNVMQMLFLFIQNSSVDNLFDFLSFTTGSRSSTTIFVSDSIAVSDGTQRPFLLQHANNHIPLTGQLRPKNREPQTNNYCSSFTIIDFRILAFTQTLFLWYGIGDLTNKLI